MTSLKDAIEEYKDAQFLQYLQEEILKKNRGKQEEVMQMMQFSLILTAK